MTDKSPMASVAAALRLKTLLEDVAEYLRTNIPSDGWGCLDKGADADREALLRRVRQALEEGGAP